MKRKNLLLTGPPGCGKTTLVRKLAEGLGGCRPVGFYTGEIRAGGTRQGFGLVSFSGGTATLSHIAIRGGHRVGKYGVDIPAFEQFLDALPFHGPGCLVIIDEIGKMECISARFRDLVEEILSSPIPCVATIALRGDRFIESLKTRPDVEMVIVSPGNRDTLLPLLTSRIREMIANASGGTGVRS
jgi:nucleoside-triphosphatase